MNKKSIFFLILDFFREKTPNYFISLLAQVLTGKLECLGDCPTRIRKNKNTLDRFDPTSV
jgi:hypothetical protein